MQLWQEWKRDECYLIPWIGLSSGGHLRIKYRANPGNSRNIGAECGHGLAPSGPLLMSVGSFGFVNTFRQDWVDASGETNWRHESYVSEGQETPPNCSGQWSAAISVSIIVVVVAHVLLVQLLLLVQLQLLQQRGQDAYLLVQALLSLHLAGNGDVQQVQVHLARFLHLGLLVQVQLVESSLLLGELGGQHAGKTWQIHLASWVASLTEINGGTSLAIIGSSDTSFEQILQQLDVLVRLLR